MSGWLGVAQLGSQLIGNRHSSMLAEEREEDQRHWQEQMSSTAYQRAVADMRRAGLNPVLAASKGFSGASTPGGGLAGGPSSPGIDFAGASAKSAQAEASKSQDLLYRQQIELSGEQAYSARTAGNLNQAQADKTKVEAASLILQQPQLTEAQKAVIARDLAQAAQLRSSAAQAESTIRLNDQELMARLAEYEKLRRAGDVHATKAGSFFAWLRALTESAGFHSSTRIGR